MKKTSKSSIIFFATILLLFLFINCLTFIISKSPTYDEPVYVSAGYIYLKEGDMNWNSEHPPLIKEIVALPLIFMKIWNPFEDIAIKKEIGIWLFAEKFLIGNDFHKIFTASRMMIAFLSILLGIYLFIWSRELWGDWGGLLSLFLYCLSPNILAHSSIATLDLGSTCFTFIYFYYLYKTLKSAKTLFVIPAGIFLGFALLSKYSTIQIIPITIIILIIHYFYERNTNRPGKNIFLHLATVLLSPILISIFIIILNYGLVFHKFSFMPYLNGLRNLSHILKKTEFYFCGKTSLEGWHSFYLITYLIKTPLTTLCLLIASIIFLIKKKLFSFDVWFIIIPIISFFLIPSITKFSIGYRYILQAAPFIFILIGSICYDKEFFKPIITKIAFTGLLFLYFINSQVTSPDYISYFNELVGGPKNGYKYLVDSNLDWGQDLAEVQLYMNKKNIDFIHLDYFGSIKPEFYEINYEPIPTNDYPIGIYAISATYLQGLFVEDKDKYAKFKQMTPTDRIGNTIFIYEIKKKP